MLDVKLIPQNQIINLVVLNHWCYTGPNKSEYKFCCNKPISRGCSHNGNYYSSGMNAASVSKIINQRCNIARSWEAPVTIRSSLQPCWYFHRKPTSKSPYPTGTRSRAETGDMATIFPLSNSENSFFPSLKYCPLFRFLKDVNYIKSVLFFLVFT